MNKFNFENLFYNPLKKIFTPIDNWNNGIQWKNIE